VLLTNGSNAAKDKLALSTSFAPGKGPGKAADGNKATAFQGALASDTDAGYWKLDLGAEGVRACACRGVHRRSALACCRRLCAVRAIH
jgi:hypothetical protein